MTRTQKLLRLLATALIAALVAGGVLGCGQMAQVLGPPEGGRVGEVDRPVLLQRDPFYLQKGIGPAPLEKEVEPAVPLPHFPAEHLGRAAVARQQQAAIGDGLGGHLVGGLGIHVDEQIPLFHRDKGEAGLAAGAAAAVLQPDPAPRHQQLPAPAGVFDMDRLLLAAGQPDPGHKPVGPGEKGSRQNLIVLHQQHLLL